MHLMSWLMHRTRRRPQDISTVLTMETMANRMFVMCKARTTATPTLTNAQQVKIGVREFTQPMSIQGNSLEFLTR